MALRTVRVKVGERWYTVEVDNISTSPLRVTVEGETFDVEVEGLPPANPTFTPSRTPQQGPTQVRPPTPDVSEKIIRSPMPGRVVAVNVRPGDTVSPGQEVCVVEAMKMEQSISTSQGGVIKSVYVQPLQQVDANDPMVELE